MRASNESACVLAIHSSTPTSAVAKLSRVIRMLWRSVAAARFSVATASHGPETTKGVLGGLAVPHDATCAAGPLRCCRRRGGRRRRRGQRRETGRMRAAQLESPGVLLQVEGPHVQAVCRPLYRRRHAAVGPDIGLVRCPEVARRRDLRAPEALQAQALPLVTKQRRHLAGGHLVIGHVENAAGLRGPTTVQRVDRPPGRVRRVAALRLPDGGELAGTRDHEGHRTVGEGEVVQERGLQDEGVRPAGHHQAAPQQLGRGVAVGQAVGLHPRAAEGRRQRGGAARAGAHPHDGLRAAAVEVDVAAPRVRGVVGSRAALGAHLRGGRHQRALAREVRGDGLRRPARQLDTRRRRRPLLPVRRRSAGPRELPSVAAGSVRLRRYVEIEVRYYPRHPMHTYAPAYHFFRV
mmetsp:Transcript_104684/g.296258  ORF Transcript_104684/g.296258 Transcript_104684/m.296258 type:complete len:406 (+) Transcript_104684:6-1223(+)